MKRARLGLVGAFTVIAATALAPVAAYAGTAAVLKPGKATLQANGAAVSIPFAVTCTAGWNGNVSAGLTQALGKDLATGYGNKGFTCTGAKQSINVFVLAQSQSSTSRPFDKGPAAIGAQFYASDPAAEECYEGGCAAPADSVMQAAPAAPPAAFQPAAFRPASMQGPVGPGGAYEWADYEGTITIVK